MRKVLVLHGPNLNLLGEREPAIYGAVSLKELNFELRSFAKAMGVILKIYQSNSEGRLIDLLHLYRNWCEGIVINPGAYTHYSYAIRDAIAAIKKPTVEVHLTDLKKRAKIQQEKFRKISVIRSVCKKQISGLGVRSYKEAFIFLNRLK